MTWLSDHWLDLLGWGGSALLVYSLMQARVLRFRVLNLLGCVVLVVFNALLAVWPMVGMNLVLGVINVWFIAKLLRERHDQDAFEVLEVGTDDCYLQYVLALNAADIARFYPGFFHDPDLPGQLAFLVQRGPETVGIVLVQADGDVARVLLDYVTERYRDFSPGEFVWRRSGLLAGHGFRRVVTGEHAGSHAAYYRRVGFRPLDDEHTDRFVLDLPA